MEARRAAYFQYLTGAAVVAYGLPVQFAPLPAKAAKKGAESTARWAGAVRLLGLLGRCLSLLRLHFAQSIARGLWRAGGEDVIEMGRTGRTRRCVTIEEGWG